MTAVKMTIDGLARRGEMTRLNASGKAAPAFRTDDHLSRIRRIKSLRVQGFSLDIRRQRGAGMIREGVGRTENGQRTVTEELVSLPTDPQDGGHHDLEQLVEPRDGVLGRVGLDRQNHGERDCTDRPRVSRPVPVPRPLPDAIHAAKLNVGSAELRLLVIPSPFPIWPVTAT